MTGFDLSTILDCYISDTNASYIYKGNDLIWQQHDYSLDYFTIDSRTDNNTISFTKCATLGDLYYSRDKITWNVFSTSITLSKYEKIYFKGDLIPSTMSPAGIGTFNTSGLFYVYGNIMSLLFNDNFIGQISLNGKYYAFQQLFDSNVNLVNAFKLILPATTLSTSCYEGMFNGCTSLIASPQLPATTLSVACYAFMFQGCTSLITAPELPATTIAQSCYTGMFKGCTSLNITPQLPATNLEWWCYQKMFEGCTSLTLIRKFPVGTIVAFRCCGEMFKDCTSLTEGPVSMPSTIANYCYAGMFKGCTSLRWLRASLFATTLAEGCYQEMFYGCRNFSYIWTAASDISATDCLDHWLYNVNSEGVIETNANITYPTGSSGLPSGWTIHSNAHDYSQDYLTLEALEAGTFTWTDNGNSRSISYSTDDGSTWTTLTTGSTTPTIAANSKVLLKATLGAGSFSINGIGTISSSGRFNVMGNIMSLVGGDNFNNLTTISNNYQFKSLFRNCTKLTDASNLILPATTLSTQCYYYLFMGCTSLTTAPQLPATRLIQSCYSSMFSNCTSLTTAPALPATTLANNCYDGMFSQCSSLTAAPALPATTLKQNCYTSMFWGCSSLTTAPELPATTLVDKCYYRMFWSCTSLTTAPELPATTLVNGCYKEMFKSCTSLNEVHCDATDISASNCLTNWLNDVSQTGDFYKPSTTTYPTGASGIPSGWTVTDNTSS